MHWVYFLVVFDQQVNRVPTVCVSMNLLYRFHAFPSAIEMDNKNSYYKTLGILTFCPQGSINILYTFRLLWPVRSQNQAYSSKREFLTGFIAMETVDTIVLLKSFE